MTHAEDSRPTVAMLVANDLSIDTRVRKIARDVANAGLDVTVLGISPGAERLEFGLGNARVVLIPVDDLLRNRTDSEHLLTISVSRTLERRLQTEAAAFFNHQRAVGASIGEQRRRYFTGRAQRRAAARTISTRLGIAGERLGHKYVLATEWFVRRRLRRRHVRYEARLARTQKRLLRVKAKELRRPDWRRIHPQLHDYEVAFGPELDRMMADVIHAHDVHLLGVAARAVGRRHVSGNPPALIYDSHEFTPGLAKEAPRDIAGWTNLEEEYIGRASHVITVAPMMADAIREYHGLDRPPTVVMNAPIPSDEGETPTIRQILKLGDDVPIVVYSGGVTPLRRVSTVAHAMSQILDAHLVLITNRDRYTNEIESIAKQLGWADRLHIVPYVDPSDAVSFLRSANVGVFPYSSGPISHRITLTNKVFEYLHAGLPVVVSDCPATAGLVTELQVGEVFDSGDVASLVEALRRVLDDASSYSPFRATPSALISKQYAWDSQREALLGVYRDVLGSDRVGSVPATTPLPKLRIDEDVDRQ